MPRLKASEIPEYREIQKAKQGGKCPITGYYLGDKIVSDHCHITGMMRGTLPSWVNSRLGKVENAVRAMGKHLPPAQVLRAIADYVEHYEQHPSFIFHYLHRTPEEKKEATKIKAAARRKAKKAAV